MLFCILRKTTGWYVLIGQTLTQLLLQVCLTVRERYAEQGVPIIMVSAKSAEDNVVQGLHSGCDDYVVKPFNRDELKARITIHLKARVSNPSLRWTKTWCSIADSSLYSYREHVQMLKLCSCYLFLQTCFSQGGVLYNLCLGSSEPQFIHPGSFISKTICSNTFIILGSECLR